MTRDLLSQQGVSREVVPTCGNSAVQFAQRLYEERGAAYYGHRSWAYQTDEVRNTYIGMAQRELGGAW